MRLYNKLLVIIKAYCISFQNKITHFKTANDFLAKLPKKVTTSSVLTSFDVESLYTNIPHNLGKQAIEYWLNQYPKSIPSRLSKEFIISSMMFILENNVFKFNNNYYKQTKGTLENCQIPISSLREEVV